MALNDVTIIKESGLDREEPNTDRTSCLICGGVAIVLDDSTTDLNTLHGPLYSVEDAEALGFDATYDSVNELLIYHHIKEYFRGYGESISRRPAKPLYLYMVSQSTPLSVMCDMAEEFSAYQAAKDAALAVKRFLVVLNPVDGYVPDITVNGFDADVALAVAKAQQTAEALYDEHGPVHFYIEGRDFNPAIPGDAIDLATLEAENVSLVIFQDLDISDSHALHNGYAAVGTYGGMITSKPTLADSPAEVGLSYQGNIQSIADEVFLNYGYGNAPLSEWSLAEQNAFYDKHYVGIRLFAETSGVYITQSFTCAAAISDFIFSELNEVHNKAHRGIYAAYVPYINTKIKLTSQGYIPGDIAKQLEEVGNKVFRTMSNNAEISDGKAVINPKQTIATTRKIEVRWKMVQQGKIENMEGALSYVLDITI